MYVRMHLPAKLELLCNITNALLNQLDCFLGIGFTAKRNETRKPWFLLL